MTNVIELSGLTKAYPNFLLDNIGFSVPKGFVTGFIGQNGAGKTTTLKLLMGMVLKDGGDIRLLGRPADEVAVKDEIGVLFDQPYYQEDWTPTDIERAVRPFYTNWESQTYNRYLERFSLPSNQKFKTMSRGMKMKLGMAVTLSHQAKLLLLDEPTSGLDPVGRDEMLEILRDYMMKEDRTVFFSTHITTDLEKIADYITYLHKGKVVYSGAKDDFIDTYCLVRGGANDLPLEKKSKIIGLREHIGGFEGMIRIKDIGGFGSGVVTEAVTLEEIMVFTNRGGNQSENKASSTAESESGKAERGV